MKGSLARGGNLAVRGGTGRGQKGLDLSRVANHRGDPPPGRKRVTAGRAGRPTARGRARGGTSGGGAFAISGHSGPRLAWGLKKGLNPGPGSVTCSPGSLGIHAVVGAPAGLTFICPRTGQVTTVARAQVSILPFPVLLDPADGRGPGLRAGVSGNRRGRVARPGSTASIAIWGRHRRGMLLAAARDPAQA